MFSALIFIFASLSVFLILTEIITLNVSYDENYFIEINFTIFAVRLYGSGKEKVKEKRKGRKRRFRPNFAFLYNFASAIIRKSEISLKKFALVIPDNDPAAMALRRGIYLSFISSLLAFAGENAKKFDSDNITIDRSANNNYKVSLDASVKISLLDILISALSCFSLIFRKNRSKSNYGREQNE